MAETITAAQLRAAAERIGNPRHWRKGPSTADGRLCARNTLARVRGRLQGVGIALLELDPTALPLTDINDCDGRLAAIAELNRLADLAEAREQAAANG